MQEDNHALIFDFDGVIADTESLHWRSWSDVLASYGLSLTWNDYCRFGRGVNDEKLLETLPQLDGKAHVLAQIRERLVERTEMVRKWCADDSPIPAQTIELLHSLQEFTLGLVTSSKRGDVEPILQRAGIHQCFRAIVYGEDTSRHKPDPAPYLLMSERLDVKIGTAFEDSEAGFASASSAGLQAILVPHPANLAEIVEKVISNLRR